MKVNIRKISEETGFSMSTVSNALNHKKGVNKVTAEKILRTAEELGYRGGDVISKIRFVIFRKNGRIIDGSSFHTSVIEGVEKQAKLMGYETLFCYVDAREPVSYTHLDVYKRQQHTAEVVLLELVMLTI